MPLPAPPPETAQPASGGSPAAADAPSGSTDQPSFIPAAQFGGARAGFAFRQGPQGLGYYRDNLLARSRSSSSAKAGASADDIAAAGMRLPTAMVYPLHGGLIACHQCHFARLLMRERGLMTKLRAHVAGG